MGTALADALSVDKPVVDLREKILDLEKALSNAPGAVFGDSAMLPLKHSFAPGVYVREIFIPKGSILTGKIHRHAHPNFLMKGEVIVVTEKSGRERLKAPLSMISEAGTKRAIIALEDTVWVTVHVTNETDLKKIEDYVIAPTYEDLLPATTAPAQIRAELESKNCLILALKEKDRDYSCLLDLPAKGTMLPFKESLKRLRVAGISTEGIFAILNSDGVFHVTTQEGNSPLQAFEISDTDMVGTWAAVAIGGAAVVGGVAGYLASPSGSVGNVPVDPNLNGLEQEQLKLLQQQDAQNQMFAPLQAEAAGYKAIYATDPRKADLLAKINAEYAKGNDAMDLRVQYTKLGFDTADPQVITGYEKTDARKVQDTQLTDLQTQQMATAKKANDALNTYLDSLNTDDYKAYQAAQQQLQAQQTQIALKQGERTQQALDGNLPLSQGTIDRKAADFQLLKENTARAGNAIIGDDPNSAYSLSSPGSQALKEFNSRYAAIEGQERQGALDTGTTSYLQAVGLTGNLGKTDLSAATGLSNPGGYASTSTSLNPGATPVTNNMSLIQGYSSAMNPYLQQQQLQNSNNQTQAQINAANQAGWLSLAGTGAGVAGGAYAKSNRRFKKNIEAIKSESDATKALAGTPVYRWNYKDEPDGSKKHLGTMTDEAPEDVVTQDGDYLDVTSYMGLLTLSTKDLHHRVLSLEGRGK
jgi:hypothetical protein